MQKPIKSTRLSDTLTLLQYEGGGAHGFWLYDDTRRRNLAIRAKTELAACVEVITYYQEKLASEEAAHKALYDKVEHFLDQFRQEEF